MCTSVQTIDLSARRSTLPAAATPVLNRLARSRGQRRKPIQVHRSLLCDAGPFADDVEPMEPPLTSTVSTLWEADGISIEVVRGRFQPYGWSKPNPTTRWGVVLARRGAYRRRADGVEHVVDANSGFVRRPGQEASVSVFTTAYEELTVLQFDPGKVGGLPDVTKAVGPIEVDPRLALAHRLLLRAVHRDDLETEIGVQALIHHCLPPAEPGRPSGRRSATVAARRRLVGDSLELLHTSFQEPLGLLELARRVGASPYHLSRVFRDVTGITISQYRIRLRLHAVLERLEEGDEDLAAVAADTGFADHGHMTRTVTRFLGAAPSELRTRLGSRSAGTIWEVLARPA
jgi:AraC-like DNA-binding protein